jgi:uncharacterized protein (DUF1778 family)
MRRIPETERKSPEMLDIKSKREPLSTRVKESTKVLLETAADKAGTTLSDLTAAILDDYADWLATLNNKKKK